MDIQSMQCAVSRFSILTSDYVSDGLRAAVYALNKTDFVAQTFHMRRSALDAYHDCKKKCPEEYKLPRH